MTEAFIFSKYYLFISKEVEAWRGKKCLKFFLYCRSWSLSGGKLYFSLLCLAKQIFSELTSWSKNTDVSDAGGDHEALWRTDLDWEEAERCQE